MLRQSVIGSASRRSTSGNILPTEGTRSPSPPLPMKMLVDLRGAKARTSRLTTAVPIACGMKAGGACVGESREMSQAEPDRAASMLPVRRLSLRYPGNSVPGAVEAPLPSDFQEALALCGPVNAPVTAFL